MTIGFASPQDAEDAFYDAIDEGTFDTLEALWDASDEVFSLVPMGTASVGRNAVLTGFPSTSPDVKKASARYSPATSMVCVARALTGSTINRLSKRLRCISNKP